jgi:hypothetical protein
MYWYISFVVIGRGIGLGPRGSSVDNWWFEHDQKQRERDGHTANSATTTPDGLVWLKSLTEKLICAWFDHCFSSQLEQQKGSPHLLCSLKNTF